MDEWENHLGQDSCENNVASVFIWGMSVEALGPSAPALSWEVMYLIAGCLWLERKGGKNLQPLKLRVMVH